jgi:hypothetical protein
MLFYGSGCEKSGATKAKYPNKIAHPTLGGVIDRPSLLVATPMRTGI